MEHLLKLSLKQTDSQLVRTCFFLEVETMNVNETEIGCFVIFFFSFFPSFLSFFLSFFFFSRVNILNCWLARYIMASDQESVGQE